MGSFFNRNLNFELYTNYYTLSKQGIEGKDMFYPKTKEKSLSKDLFNNEKGEVPLLYRWGMNPSKVRNKCSSLY